MPDVLIASDESWVREEIRSVLSGRSDITVREVSSGVDAVAAVYDKAPALAVLDLQIGNMGAMATTLDLRLDESAGRLPHVPVLMLLDRRADVFLARRAGAEGFLVKPLDPIRVRRAVTALLEGRTFEDSSFQPPTVPEAAGAIGAASGEIGGSGGAAGRASGGASGGAATGAASAS